MNKLTCRFIPRMANDLAWESLRTIRNACIDGLTGDRSEITQGDQHHYRRFYDSEMIRHYLFLDQHGHAVAYGRIEWKIDGTCVPSLGVQPESRGLGYGHEVVKKLMMIAGAPMKGELFLDNTAIKAIDFSLGWKPSGPADGNVQPVECAWPPPFVRESQLSEQANSLQDALDEIVRYHESSGDGVEERDR